MSDNKIIPTNRYENDKRVFVKRIDVGSIPKSSNKDVSIGLTNVTIIDTEGRISRTSDGLNMDLPYSANGYEIAIFHMPNTNSIRIVSAGDMSSYSGYVNVYFTYNESSDEPTIVDYKIIKAKNSVGLVGDVSDVYSESTQDSYSCNYVNNLNGKLLWSNPNPTSEFASQNITLSSDDYDELDWYFISDVNIEKPVIIKETSIKQYGVQSFFSSNSALKYWARRIVYNSDTSYSVDNAKSIDSSGTNNMNSILVPLYVVGKKNNLFN